MPCGNSKWLPDFIERLKASAWHQLYLLPFTRARSESINADCPNSNFLQLGRRSGRRPQRTVYPQAVTCQLCNTLRKQESNPQPSDCESDTLPVVLPRPPGIGVPNFLIDLMAALHENSGVKYAAGITCQRRRARMASIVDRGLPARIFVCLFWFLFILFCFWLCVLD